MKQQNIIMKNKNKANAGFTLIELSIVIIIIAITMIPLIQAIERYYENRRIDYTQKVIAAATTMISEYPNAVVDEVYPCPAYRDKPITDVDYGVSPDCSALPADVDQPGECYRGVCIVESNVDRDDDGNDDWIIIGGFPIALIQEEAAKGNIDYRTADQFSTRMDLDGWGNQLTYAVSYNYTIPGNREKYWLGVVDARDEFGLPTAGVGDNAHFVVVSHGPNQQGAYNGNGIVGFPCDTTTVEGDNCDNDETFVQGLGFYKANTNKAYDDFVRFYSINSQSIWDEDEDDAWARDQVYFSPSGNLSIAMDSATLPSVALEVNGEIKVNNNLLADEICDSTGLCFNTALITGSETCSGVNIMRGIGNNDLDCVTPSTPAPVGTCEKEVGGGPDDGDPTNNVKGFIQGFKSDGGVICYYKP
ncbi:MAG: prepilin-type N-terminal cleavage/methylation domain-containing protein [Pseudomonadota bacterium]|nr:prepilin-type N-terminal cleavage/methylation domain-containing protein [Pseudomonadota bacterium]MED5422270.1 prepilin-type N-terminal cleavage/methylation domain-containing protein [Pseudomonadota bacterium]MEE3322952.1 prepilin-type N-terminal cleavage/methylation domain-containing protein [Pseudomonadota bacterium]